MNNDQSSDAVRRKRPAARRATSSEASDATSQTSTEVRASAESRNRTSSTPPAPYTAVSVARESAPKRATARRVAAARAKSATASADTALEQSARQLTRAQIDQHVRESSRLVAHLATADMQPPQHDSLLRKLIRIGLRNRSDQVDDFGLDSVYEESMRPLFERMCNDWFRTQVDGMQHIPADGRALLVGNHSGALPWDGIMLRTALRLHHKTRRELRWLVEDHVFHAPFLGTFVNRIGAVRACQENAERLLQRESLLAVFPEGIKGIAKPYSERYKLQRFGRGGYVRLALRTGAPVIPVAIVGAEETHPLLYKVNTFAKSVGLPFIPVTPTFPWLGPLGIAPLPSRWRIAIGPPVREISRHDADAANDEVLVHELNECVRASVRTLLEDALRRRGDKVYVG